MQFGAHESISGGVFNAITRGETATCDTVQIFNKSNSQWRAKKLTQEEIDEYLTRIEDTGVTVACSHSSYLINIGSPDEALGEKSRKSLQEEVERCNRLEIPNLVFHPGSHVGSGEEPGMDRIADNCNRVLADVKDNTVTLTLETTAGQGSNLGYSFEQIAYMLDQIDDQRLVRARVQQPDRRLHGEGMAAHQWVAKLGLYEKPLCVPLILSQPSIITHPGQRTWIT